jgi:hypothetical protein
MNPKPLTVGELRAAMVALAVDDSERTMREGILVGRSVRTRNGCWVVYYADRSAVAVFGDELAALRHAQEKSMDVKFMSWGDEL